MSEKKEKKVSSNKRDIDLLKIQLLSDYYGNFFNVMSSLIVGAFIALGIGGLFFSWEQKLGIPQIIYLTLFGVYLTICLFITIRKFEENITRSNYWFKQIEEGKSSPSLDEMKEVKIPKESEKKRARLKILAVL